MSANIFGFQLLCDKVRNVDESKSFPEQLMKIST